MTDHPTPPETSGDPQSPPLAPEAPRPKRPWTILGRLAAAGRWQNWFAVALEVLIVIAGPVLATYAAASFVFRLLPGSFGS